MVAGEALQVVSDEVPVASGDRACVLSDSHLRIELAALAKIRHSVYVGTSGGVGLGRHHSPVGIERHANNVCRHDPGRAIGKGIYEPVVHFTWLKTTLHKDVAENHESRNVMGPGVGFDLADCP